MIAMKTILMVKTALVAAAAAIFSSCYYDPSYGGYGSSYGTYGVSASFVSTSSDYWFYDPSVRCYYDRRRSCYYDPYLSGYYPRGYTPRPISNCPHPYGWGGKGRAPVPHGINGRTINNHQNRVAQLRTKNYSWANQVHVRNDAKVGRWQANQTSAASNFRANQERNRHHLLQRQVEIRTRNEANIADARARSQASVDAVRSRNAQIRAKATQNQEALRQRAAANQAQRQSNLRAAQNTQRQRMEKAKQQRAQPPAGSGQPSGGRRRNIN